MGTDLPLTQPDGSIPPASFLRVAVEDIDIDGDTLTNAEEHAVGSSPYFADTNGNGIADGLEVRFGNNPSAGMGDGNGDGIPDNEIYSVVFEVQQENHNVNSAGPYYLPFAGSGDNFHYLTSKDIEIFSRSGAALLPEVTDAKRTATYTYLSAGEVLTYHDSQIELPPPQGPNSELGVGESYESDPTQTTVVGPTTTPAEVKTVTTSTTGWRIKKQGNTIRTGTQTDINTVQKNLSDGLSYQDFWATYVKPLAFTEYIEGIYGPAEPANYLRSVGGDVWAAEVVRDLFRNGNFQLDGMISSPSQGYFGTYGEDDRLKRIRWRWVRFNPSKPFGYEYVAPPADYRKDFYIRVEQTDELGDRSSGYGQHPDVSTKETKGIIKIECAGSEGSNWKEIPMAKFNTYKIADPTSLATMNYTKWGYSCVRMNLTPVEVAVDYNRDGEISFDGQDKNTVEKPFRFWVNNDQDDVEADEPIEVEPNDRDWLDNTIATKRDLEDFCRLKVNTGISFGDLINGNFKVGLKFVDTASGNPKIKVWPNQSASGDADYLKDLTAAQSQISKSPFSINNGVILIPSSYWVQSGNSTANLIFEGETEGLAKLVVVIQKEDGTEICQGTGTWIQLMDVRKMYQRARIVNEAEQIPDPWVNQNPPAQTWNWDPNGNPYSEDPNADAVTAVLVHGWRMPYNCYVNWADTSYKRLWHQGFKGKFYSFRWPTYSADNTIFRNNSFDNWQETNAPVPPGGMTYNPSEYRAWLCGPALASFVNQLPNPARRNLFAHSMGNVVAGSALRAGMKITNYAMCNAAMSAMAYDASPALIPAPTTLLPTNLVTAATPDNDDYLSVRQSYGLADKFNVPSNGTFSMPVVSNFGLPNDAAVGQWSSNNDVIKPQIYGLSAGSYNYVALGPAAGRLAFAFDNNSNTAIRDVTAPAEAFAYITKSKTRTVGADLRTRGIIATENVVDLSTAEFNFGVTHSAVWRWNNQSTSAFWKRLVKQLKLKNTGL